MKRLGIIILSVMLMSFTGCGNSASNEAEIATYNSEDKEVETPEQTEEMEPTEVPEEETEEDKSEEAEVTESESEESTVEEETKEPETDKENSDNGSEEKAPDKKPEETVKQEPEPVTPESEPEQPTPEPTPEPEPEPIVEAVSYDPSQVVSLAIAKCQAGGMITTQDNLANALAEGKITQEEYDEYYPYDGLESSYYSVFVETDLNIAATTSGTRLGSVDAIADHIAGMLLLESSPVFNIVYVGVYDLNGTDFYEFRCLR